MIVELLKLKPEGLHVVTTLDLADLVREDAEVHGLTPVSADLQCRPRGGSYVVDGEIRGSVRLACSRCAEDFDHAFESRFHAEFRPRPASFAQEVEVRDEDFYMSYLEEGQEELDLRDVVREQVLLVLPMRPLCRPDCRGLCPHCGANLERGDCTCPPAEEIDPRLAVLADLKKRMED